MKQLLILTTLLFSISSFASNFCEKLSNKEAELSESLFNSDLDLADTFTINYAVAGVMNQEINNAPNEEFECRARLMNLGFVEETLKKLQK